MDSTIISLFSDILKGVGSNPHRRKEERWFNAFSYKTTLVGRFYHLNYSSQLLFIAGHCLLGTLSQVAGVGRELVGLRIFYLGF
ncbi:hypothetical protein [Salegentibacter sp. 24]|uniref:hypothetical protein n=1 Tax=Salegentibacter sp. 24 TaxID=2183986 RepID=UPI00105C60A3|nr:hypothetical protein [Salegentibacter sp. 24]